MGLAKNDTFIFQIFQELSKGEIHLPRAIINLDFLSGGGSRIKWPSATSNMNLIQTSKINREQRVVLSLYEIIQRFILQVKVIL